MKHLALAALLAVVAAIAVVALAASAATAAASGSGESNSNGNGNGNGNGNDDDGSAEARAMMQHGEPAPEPETELLCRRAVLGAHISKRRVPADCDVTTCHRWPCLSSDAQLWGGAPASVGRSLVRCHCGVADCHVVERCLWDHRRFIVTDFHAR
jgi:hypothetical protein